MNWTWEIMSEPTMNSRLSEREAEGWSVRSITEAGRSDRDYYKVFMSRSAAASEPPTTPKPDALRELPGWNDRYERWLRSAHEALMNDTPFAFGPYKAAEVLSQLREALARERELIEERDEAQERLRKVGARLLFLEGICAKQESL